MSARLYNAAVAGRAVVLPVDGIVVEFDADGLSEPVSVPVAEATAKVPGYEVRDGGEVEVEPEPELEPETVENPFADVPVPASVRRGRGR